MAPPSAGAGAGAAAGCMAIAGRWRELQGEDKWKGLLDPLDMDLRKSIISYGELAEATYDGFNTASGTCLYDCSDLLIRTGVAAADHYEVTKLVYATEEVQLPLPPWCAVVQESDWIGYVAVATDRGVAALGRREIVVVWRGTVTYVEKINDAEALLVSAEPVLGSVWEKHHDAKVHVGFKNLYAGTDPDCKLSEPPPRARDQVLAEVRKLMEAYKDEETSITVTGHSLGAAISLLNAVDIVASGVNRPPPPSNSSRTPTPCPVTAIVFACPRVGNDAFNAAFNSLLPDLRALHVKNENPIDVVPTLPPLNLLWYVDVPAVVLRIHTALSPFIKDPGNSIQAHNLELYLHGVAGEQGDAAREFKLEVARNVALVNKGADMLKDECQVPANWWESQTKFMVMNAPGKWELKPIVLVHK